MGIPVATSELIGTVLEVFAYGIYVVVFPQCIQVVWRRHLGGALSTYLLFTSAAIFFLITMHLVVDMTRAMAAFCSRMSEPDYPSTYFAVVDTTLNKAKTGTLVSTTIFADALLVYRTFVVWGRNYIVVVIPSMLWLLDIALSIWYTWSTVQAKPGISVLKSTVFARGRYFFAVTLSLNLFCTLLIAFRIWTIQRQVSGFAVGRSSGNRVLSIILESAAIYSVAQIFLITLSETHSSIEFFFLNSMPPIIGSVFSYVVLRTSVDHRRYGTATISTLLNDAIGRTHTSGPLGSSGTEVPLDGVHIHLERIDDSTEPTNSIKTEIHI